MLSRFQLLTRGFRSSSTKGNSSSSNIDKKVTQLENTLKAGPLEEVGKFPGMPKQIPKPIDKLFLVWSGHYKTMADVPSRVEAETMHKAKTWGRIRLNVGTLILGVFISIGMVILGKRAASRGLTVEGQNLAWHKQINEEHAAKLKKSSD